MKCIASRINSAEQDIINNLQSSGLKRRKGEDQLFVKYSYLVEVGKKKYLLDKEDSFNAYSDTVLAAIFSVTNGTFQGKSSLKTYLHGIFYNKCIDVVRKKTSNKNSIHSTMPLNETTLHLSDTTISVIDELVGKFDFYELTQKLAQLSITSQKVLLLSAEGFTDKKIASILDFKSACVVKTTRQRCLKKLRQLVQAKV